MSESEAGPSGCQPSRQGYCGYCRVLYTHLDQHLSSLRHLDSVRTPSSGSGPCSHHTRLNLLDRFLQDVQEHHPHRYNDPRPSHADLPSVSSPLCPRVEPPDPSGDSRRNLPTYGGASCLPANRRTPCSPQSQSEDTSSSERHSTLIRQDPRGPTSRLCSEASPPHSDTPPCQPQATPPVHRKAHRKSNRRKPSESSSSSQATEAPQIKIHKDLKPRSPLCQRPVAPTGSHSPIKPRAPYKTELGKQTSRELGALSFIKRRSGIETTKGPPEWPPPGPKPWLNWERERREALKKKAFSSDPVDQTIEEVIQMFCHSTSPLAPQVETESLGLSLASTGTQSDDWDSPVQVVSQTPGSLADTPVQMKQTEGRDFSHLTQVQVHVEDQMYSEQLDSALLVRRVRKDDGFWNQPIEEVLPVPEHIPESFRGKTWMEIEQEDEEKVERLVQQFRRGRFVCYFDSESLARYGKRSKQKKKLSAAKEAEPESSVLPLMDMDEDDPACVRRRRRRSFRMASRCQVVKVSHSTQTVRLVVPAVPRVSAETPSLRGPAANQSTPEMQMWRSLPSSFWNIVTPVQPRTSLVYLLCSQSSSTPISPQGCSFKRCRRRRRPVDLQGLKVRYKRLPVRFYEPGTNRILKNPPKGSPWLKSSSGPPPPCVRQLFRSLSPDLNTDEGPRGDPGLLGTCRESCSRFDSVRRRRRQAQAPPTSCQSSGRETGRQQRRARIPALPLQPRREGLRPAAPGRKHYSTTGPTPLVPRRGRSQRGRGHDRVSR